MSASEWYRRYRQAWIKETIRVFGTINREHIRKKFGLSAPQASLDLRQFIKENPSLIEYSRVTQRYELAKKRVFIRKRKP